jgi:LmbE family N-acetylglucosaminyl deacetylase
MQALELETFAATPGVLLCIGAHCDDIEIGCGGTVLRLLELNPQLEVHWIVLCSDALRRREALDAARRFLGDDSEKRVQVLSHRDGFLPYQGGDVKEYFESLKRTLQPDLILTHFRGDLHQDHRLVSELTWNTFRDHLILEFEIPKYDGDLGAPNLFVPLSESQVARKIENVLGAFASQRSRRWFREDTFRALMRLRGVECNAAAGYAEAFYARKLVLQPRAVTEARWRE